MRRRTLCKAGAGGLLAVLGGSALPYGSALAQSALAPAAANADFSALLMRHVRPLRGGHASQVDYAGLMRDRAQLQAVLERFSAVSAENYAGWPKAERLAFLINAYNGFTLEKVLTRWPKLASIRDFGRVFNNPWKDRFFTLLGAPRALDDIEHGLIRAPGAFNEPRIHVAVNCASIGCPALRAEAWDASRLDAQLEDAMQGFLSDRSRNRYDPVSGNAELSSLFDWYGDDFKLGHQGFNSLQDLLARYADQLADTPADRARLRAGNTPIRFLSYDWALNDLPR